MTDAALGGTRPGTRPEPAAPRRRAVPAIIGVVALALAVSFHIVTADRDDLSPMLRVAVLSVASCAGVYGLVRAARPDWFTPRVHVSAVLLALALTWYCVVFFTPDPAVPAAPARLMASSTGTSVTLTWDRSADDGLVKSYELYRSDNRIYEGRATSFTDNEVRPGQQYEYSVIAVASAGPSSPEVSVSVRTLSISSSLQPPSAVTVTPTSATTAVVLWSAPQTTPAVAAYELFRDGVKIADVAGVSYTDTTLAAGTTYRYMVRSVDAANRQESADSVTAAATTPELASAAPQVVVQPSQPAPSSSPKKATPPKPKCSGNLISGWQLSAVDDAADGSNGLPADILRGHTYVKVTFNMHGLDGGTGPGDSVLVFVQNDSWFTANLASWGTNGHDGAQSINIPLTEFRQLPDGYSINTDAAVPAIRAHFRHEGAWTVDILSVKACG